MTSFPNPIGACLAADNRVDVDGMLAYLSDGVVRAFDRGALWTM